jgi:hypothetical protein
VKKRKTAVGCRPWAVGKAVCSLNSKLEKEKERGAP